MPTLHEWIEQNSSMIEALRKQENLFRQAMSPAIQSYVFSINTLAKSGAFEAFQQNNHLSEIKASVEACRTLPIIPENISLLNTQLQEMCNQSGLNNVISSKLLQNWTNEDLQELLMATNKLAEQEALSSPSTQVSESSDNSLDLMTKAELCKSILEMIKELTSLLSPVLLVPTEADKIMSCIWILLTLYMLVKLVQPTKSADNSQYTQKR